jgi:NADH-quinone oxidoreductase subunit C
MNDRLDASTALDAYGTGLAERLGGRAVVEHDTVRIYIDRDDWVETLRRARDEEGLSFFSWLSGIDWSRDVEVGETVEEPDDLEERFEVMCRLSSVENADGAQFIAGLPKDDPVIDSITGLFGGAEWHEREAHDMFGIEFAGNPNLTPIYLPEGFIGHPLRKSYPLLAREVKPWPGDVDVEGLPEEDDASEADA